MNRIRCRHASIPTASPASLGPPRSRVTVAAVVGAAVVGAAIFTTAGCYHAGQHALAQELQTSFKEARLGESVDEERKLAERMLQAELAAVRRSVDAERDNALVLILGQTLDGKAGDRECDPRWSPGRMGSLLCDLDFRIERLVRVEHQCAGASQSGGQSTAVPCAPDKVTNAITDHVRSYRSDAHAVRRLEEIARTVDLMRRAAGKPAWPMSCASKQDADALQAALDAAGADQLGWPMARLYLDDCRQHLAFVPAVAATGLLPEAREELRRLGERLDEAGAEARRLKQDFDKALKAYEKAADDKGDVATALKTVKEKLAAFAERAAKLDAADVLPLDLAEAGARYDAIGAAIQRILEGKADPGSGVERVVGAIAAIDKRRSEEVLPLLLLESERLRGVLDGVRARLAHAERRRELLRARVDALSDEYDRLTSARQLAIGEARACATAKPSLFESLQAASGTCKLQLSTVLLEYANAWSVGERRARAALVLLNGDVHAEAIDLAGAAIRQWEGVLAVPIDSVVKRHASGLRPEDLARLLVEAAGFAAVATAAAVF